jgi:hypothetical protein
VRSWRGKDKWYAFGVRRGHEFFVECRERNSFALREFEIGSVVERKSMTASQVNERSLIGQAVEVDCEPRQLTKELVRLGLGRAPATLSEEADIADLEPPLEGNDGSVLFEPAPGGVSTRVLLVPKEPAPND